MEDSNTNLVLYKTEPRIFGGKVQLGLGKYILKNLDYTFSLLEKDFEHCENKVDNLHNRRNGAISHSCLMHFKLSGLLFTNSGCPKVPIWNIYGFSMVHIMGSQLEGKSCHQEL